ncbi:MAG: hypothetical protein LBQ70_02510 [Prevotellaceae bacterium]|jgi:hypothetical protein|nr:hypothetical protein [Prevotellaceae bacterium]
MLPAFLSLFKLEYAAKRGKIGKKIGKNSDDSRGVRGYLPGRNADSDK